MDEQENNWGSGSWGSGPHHRHEGMHGPPSGGPEGKFMGPRHGFCGHGSSDFGPHHYGYIGMHDRPGGMYMHPRMGPWAQGPCRFRQQQFKFMNMQRAPWGGQYGMHPGMGSWGMRQREFGPCHYGHEGMHRGPCHGPEGMHMHPKIGHGMGFPSGDHHQMHFMRHINWETFMPFELAETCEIYIITMPLPGFETKDIEVSVKEHRILIEAKRSEPEKSVSEPDVEAGAEDKCAKGPHPIISFARFFWDKPHVQVEIPVKEQIDTENVKAKFIRGILTVTFQKKPAIKVEVEE